MTNTVFITGSTGFIGANLVARILRHEPTTRLFALARSTATSRASDRFWNTLHHVDKDLNLASVRDRVVVLEGDICQEMLGLQPDQYQRVVIETTHIIHSAATVEFHHPLEEARRINCGGTRNVLALAEAAKAFGQFRLFTYVSTAYVSGKREGVIRENELRHSSGFANTYEQSKYESERLVEEQKDRLPVIILRPSIVVGDSRTGITTAFNVLYVPLKYIFKGYVPCLPGSSTNPLDVVPVDYVCEAAYHIIFKAGDTVGKTFHLTAGSQHVCTAGDIVGQSVAYFNSCNPEKRVLSPPFVPGRLFSAMLRGAKIGGLIGKMLIQYECYLSVRRTYDISQTSLALAGSGITPPPYTAYLPHVMHYFIEATAERGIRKAA